MSIKQDVVDVLIPVVSVEMQICELDWTFLQFVVVMREAQR